MSKCQECGAVVGNLKSHNGSDKCYRYKVLNSLVQFKCRKCGVLMEKSWHAESHHCGVKEVMTEVLQRKLDIFSRVLVSMGIDISNWETLQPKEEVKEIKEEVIREEPKEKEIIHEEPKEEEEEEEVEESNEVEEPTEDEKEVLSSKNVCIEQLHRDFQAVIDNKIEDDEDYDFILGVGITEFVSKYYHEYSYIRSLIHKTKEYVKSISKDNNKREQFISGVVNSIYDYKYQLYTLIAFDIFENPPDDMKDLVHYDNTNIIEQFDFVYALLPIEVFIDKVVKNKCAFFIGQYYIDKEIDPYLLNLTEKLSAQIMKVCVSLFRQVYKCNYGNNIYKDGWKKTMKHYLPIFRNIEIASTIFDLGHILRKRITSSLVLLVPQKPSQESLDTFHLISTKIHHGKPGYDMHNFFEIVFDGNVNDVSRLWMEKYLGGLKTYANEYKSYARFQNSV